MGIPIAGSDSVCIEPGPVVWHWCAMVPCWASSCEEWPSADMLNVGLAQWEHDTAWLEGHTHNLRVWATSPDKHILNDALSGWITVVIVANPWPISSLSRRLRGLSGEMWLCPGELAHSHSWVTCLWGWYPGQACRPDRQANHTALTGLRVSGTSHQQELLALMTSMDSLDIS